MSGPARIREPVAPGEAERRSSPRFTILPAVLFVAACASGGGSLEGSRLRSAFPADGSAPERRLLAAAVDLVGGLDADRAIAAMAADGAACEGRRCVWTSIHGEGLGDALFGVRMAGPPRTTVLLWTVAVTGPAVRGQGDLDTSVLAASAP